jgi:hypothetical protein
MSFQTTAILSLVSMVINTHFSIRITIRDTAKVNRINTNTAVSAYQLNLSHGYRTRPNEYYCVTIADTAQNININCFTSIDFSQFETLTELNFITIDILPAPIARPRSRIVTNGIPNFIYYTLPTDATHFIGTVEDISDVTERVYERIFHRQWNPRTDPTRDPPAPSTSTGTTRPTREQQIAPPPCPTHHCTQTEHDALIQQGVQQCTAAHAPAPNPNQVRAQHALEFRNQLYALLTPATDPTVTINVHRVLLRFTVNGISSPHTTHDSLYQSLRTTMNSDSHIPASMPDNSTPERTFMTREITNFNHILTSTLEDLTMIQFSRYLMFAHSPREIDHFINGRTHLCSMNGTCFLNIILPTSPPLTDAITVYRGDNRNNANCISIFRLISRTINVTYLPYPLVLARYRTEIQLAVHDINHGYTHASAESLLDAVLNLNFT